MGLLSALREAFYRVPACGELAEDRWLNQSIKHGVFFCESNMYVFMWRDAQVIGPVDGVRKQIGQGFGRVDGVRFSINQPWYNADTELINAIVDPAKWLSSFRKSAARINGVFDDSVNRLPFFSVSCIMNG